MNNIPNGKKNTFAVFNNGHIYRDESITKYSNTNSQLNNIRSTTTSNTLTTTTREFGRDLTNIINPLPQSQRDNRLSYTSLINNLKSNNPNKQIKKEKEDTKKPLSKNDTLYNLRPRNSMAINTKPMNTSNTINLANNENINTLNINCSMRNMNILEKKVDPNDMEIDQEGEILLTNLNPSVTPFINLKTEDNMMNFEGPTKCPQLVSEYLYDIAEALRKSEMINHPIYGYMDTQHDINEKMRAILLDWLVDVHLKFKLVHETLFLTAQIIDRFLSKVEINRNKLQLVGVASLFIASKYEEIYPPELKDFVYITDKAYSKADILQMEKEILVELNFDITYPSTLRFLEVYLQLLNFSFDLETLYLCHYLLELFLIEYKMIKYPPSLIAASTIYYTLKVKKQIVSEEVYMVLGLPEFKLKECAQDISLIHNNSEKSSLEAVRNKYSSSKFNEVGKMKK
jgi:hypothetical protein